MINQGSGSEGVFETAEISISGGSVKVSLEVQARRLWIPADYVRFYKIVDGGAKVLIGQQTGACCRHEHDGGNEHHRRQRSS